MTDRNNAAIDLVLLSGSELFSNFLMGFSQVFCTFTDGRGKFADNVFVNLLYYELNTRFLYTRENSFIAFS